FPSSEIYASLFPPRVQALIGKVGPETKGVAKMLKSVGFQYANRIDPFDGGPHYEVDFASIRLIQDSRAASLRIGEIDSGRIGLVGREKANGTSHFRAVRTPFLVRDAT